MRTSNSKRTSSKTYIVAEAGDKIFFIDQHVAAERVLYERFVNQMQSDGIPVQGLLLPVTLEATAQQLSALKVHGDIFSKLGFDLEEFGENTILIRAIPSPLPTRVAAQTVTDLLDKLPEAPHTDVQLPEAIDNALITLACKSAVKAGDTLDTKEMVNLIKELSQAKLPFNCPHSRPIIVEMGRDELEPPLSSVIAVSPGPVGTVCNRTGYSAGTLHTSENLLSFSIQSKPSNLKQEKKND